VTSEPGSSPPPSGNGESGQDEKHLRERALVSLRKKRDFAAHVMAYLLVNTMLVVIWAMTGHGFFWPVFPILGWGIGLIFHAWDTYGGRPSEEAIQKEMERLR
jgi:hypothetical protein